MPDPNELQDLLAEVDAEVAGSAGAQAATDIQNEPVKLNKDGLPWQPGDEEAPDAAATEAAAAAAAALAAEEEAAAAAAKNGKVDPAAAAAAAAAAEKDGKQAAAAAAPDAEPALPADIGGTKLSENTIDQKALADLQAKESGIEKQLDELEKKLTDGELSPEDFAKESRKLNKQLTDVVSDIKAEARSQKDQQARLAREWNRAQDTFFAANPKFSKNDTLYRALDAEVRAITAEAKNADLTYLQVLEKAKINLVRELGLKDETPAPGAKKGEEKPASQVSDQNNKGKDAGKKPDLPPSMDDLPSGGEQQDDPFAALDRLKGKERTDAFNRMTPEQQKRYLGG